MRKLPDMRASALCALALCFGWDGSAEAAAAPRGVTPEASTFVEAPVLPGALLLAEEATAPAEPAPQPRPGELVIPGSAPGSGTQDGGEKKCMTVCVRWGEECILINKGAGGMERKCRRTCQQLGEECL